MAKQQKPTVKKDTTVIKTPYKVTSKELKNVSLGKNLRGVPTPQDSTRKKITHNSTKVVPSLLKRNTERAKEGKKPISKSSVFGTKEGDHPFKSNKGKNISN